MFSENIQYRLNGIVEELGEIYLSMTQNYPDFFERLEKEFGKLKFHKNDSYAQVINKASRGISQLLEDRDRMMNDNHNREEELIKTVVSELAKLAGMEGEIDGIEGCSEDLELISLNAMVSALKAGNRGGAFPYITRELQRVSRLSAECSSSLRYQGGILDREYKKFIEKIRQSQKDTGTEIRTVFTSLNEMVTRLKNTGESFTEQCLALESVTLGIKKPLHMIIEEVQKHDIVRQSINHIILSLDEIESHDKDNELGHRLDSLKFSSQVYELSRFIIEDIKESVKLSFDRFTEENGEMEKIINQINNKTHTIDDQTRQDQDFSHFVDSLESSLKSRTQFKKAEGINDDRAMFRVYEMIDDLDDGIRRFSKILNTIRNIHVSSRIEVVKLNSMENMGNIIFSIDETVGQMESRLNAVSHSVEEFRKASGEIIRDFTEYYTVVNDDLSFGFEESKGIVRAIQLYQNNLLEQIENISKVSGEFSFFSQMINGHLQKMESLLIEIEGISHLFEEKKALSDTLFDNLLKESGQESWELKEDGIIKLIDKFTIFIHKKKFTEGDKGTVMKIDNEQAQASEITLF